MFKFLKNKTNLKIAGATMTIIFSLATCFSGALAWFGQQRAATLTTGAFSVTGPESVMFELYYLSSFTDSQSNTKPGNYNSTISAFSGYEISYPTAGFTKINYEDGQVTNDPDPTNISHLWPAHKLTFAIVVTSQSITKLALTNWSENEGHEPANAPMTEDDNYVRLSWATDIYGSAYSVANTGNIPNDIATAYQNYHAPDFSDSETYAVGAQVIYNKKIWKCHTAVTSAGAWTGDINWEVMDVFDYSETNVPTNPKEKLYVIDNVPTNETGYYTVVFFTIEFSDSSDTYYRLDKETGKFIKDAVYGNSNCYEGLAISSLEFAIEQIYEMV